VTIAGIFAMRRGKEIPGKTRKIKLDFELAANKFQRFAIQIVLSAAVRPH
jgi:hypothetical protein